MWFVRFHSDPTEHPAEVYAEDLDFQSSMPFVVISGIRTKHRSAIIHVPESDDYKDLVEAKRVVVPYGNICVAYEIDEPREVRQIEEVRNGHESSKI